MVSLYSVFPNDLEIRIRDPLFITAVLMLYEPLIPKPVDNSCVIICFIIEIVYKGQQQIVAFSFHDPKGIIVCRVGMHGRSFLLFQNKELLLSQQLRNLKNTIEYSSENTSSDQKGTVWEKLQQKILIKEK